MRCYRWDPVTGEQRPFDSPDEAPADWLDHHPGDPDLTKGGGERPKADKGGGERPKADKGAAAPKDDAAGMKRADIIAALKSGGVAFDVKAKTPVLEAQLREALGAALTGAGRTFPADASTADLLKIVQGG